MIKESSIIIIFCLGGTILFGIYFIIESIQSLIGEITGGDVFILCGTIGYVVLGIVMFSRELKYRDTNSNLIIDKYGVRYRSKVAEYYIAWEDVQIIRAEMKIMGNGEPMPYIVFYTDYAKQRRLKLLDKDVSDGFIFVHYEKEIEHFLDRLCGWSIINPYNRLGKYRKNWERKQIRAWKRLLKEADNRKWETNEKGNRKPDQIRKINAR